MLGSKGWVGSPWPAFYFCFFFERMLCETALARPLDLGRVTGIPDLLFPFLGGCLLPSLLELSVNGQTGTGTRRGRRESAP